jgi:hypothetical protein
MSLNLIDTWKEEVRKMLPPAVRHFSLLNFLGSLVKPLQTKNDELVLFEAAIRKRLKYNGQVMVLEASLNEIFDITIAPFIKVETNLDPGSTPDFFYGVADATPTFTAYGIADGVANYIISDPNGSNTIVSFRVLVPVAIDTQALRDNITTEVNLYKIAGKTFEIITY